MRCSHCNGNIIRDHDKDTGWEYVCLNCGRRPAIKGLAAWYAQQEQPTGTYYKQGSKAPPTPRYE